MSECLGESVLDNIPAGCLQRRLDLTGWQTPSGPGRVRPSEHLAVFSAANAAMHIQDNAKATTIVFIIGLLVLKRGFRI